MKIQDQLIFNSLQKRLKMLSDVAADTRKLLLENLKGIDSLTKWCCYLGISIYCLGYWQGKENQSQLSPETFMRYH